MDSQKSPKYDWSDTNIKYPSEADTVVRQEIAKIWQSSGHKDSAPSLDYTEGFLAGLIYAKENMWINASVKTPEDDGAYITITIKDDCSGHIEIAPWKHGAYQGDLHYQVNLLKTAKVAAWMPIPAINIYHNESEN